MLKVNSDIIANLLWFVINANNWCIAKKIIFAFMFIISNHQGINCLSSPLRVEPCNVMFKVISDIMAHRYDIWNTIVFSVNTCNNVNKMNCAMMFIIRNHHWIKCLSNILQVEPCNVMHKVISNIMSHCCDMWNTNVIAINFCDGEWKWLCIHAIIICNHYGIKCLSNLLQLEPCNVMIIVISDIIAHWYDI